MHSHGPKAKGSELARAFTEDLLDDAVLVESPGKNQWLLPTELLEDTRTVGIHFYNSEGLTCQTGGCTKGKIVVTVNQYGKIFVLIKCYIAEAFLSTYFINSQQI